MARLLRMPEVAANTLEATLSEWPLGEDAEFSDGDAIATVETDKAVVDVPAEGGGVIVRTLVAPGATVAVGAPMALLAEVGEVIDDVDAVLAQLGGGAQAPVLDDPADAVELNGQTPPEAVVGTAAPQRIFASPLARRLARDLGLSLEELSGTGPGGRVVRDDVRRAATSREAPPTPTPAPPTPSVIMHGLAESGSGNDQTVHDHRQGVVGVKGGAAEQGFEDVPHTRMRRAIASRLAESNREAPAFQIRGSARVDALLALRTELNAAGTGTKVSVNDLVVAAAARTHAAMPELNVIWTPAAVRRFRTVDIAVAVATDTGLVTPVLRDVGGRTVSSIAAANADLVERARAGSLRQDELEGGSLTVSNLGGFGTEDFTAVINPPQAAILAVGAARPEAVVTAGEVGVATVLRVTLSVDHRPIDGTTAARWMRAFLALLESPLRILA